MNLPAGLGHLLFLMRFNFPNSKTRLVGGCVRDFLLGKEPKDYDIVTDIDMDSLEDFFNESQEWKVDATGKKFLVLSVSKIIHSFNGSYTVTFEIANYRKDGVYLDGRRPEKVEIGTIEEDAKRRDFTINALYYDDETKRIESPIDSAFCDLGQRKLKFIGKPEERIKEDHLRVFRFYRFISEKGLNPDKKSLSACRQFFDEAVKNTAGERIRTEIERMI